MKRDNTKNGSGKTEIVTDDNGGRTRTFATSHDNINRDELPIALSHGLADWLRQNPNVRLLATLGVEREGEMVAIHAFYERVVQS